MPQFRRTHRFLAIIEAALQHYGRSNLLDWPAKFSIIVSKTDALSLPYVVEALYTHMWRRNEADSYGVTDLKKIVIPEILWARQCMRTINRQHPELFKPPTDLADKQGFPASRFLERSLAFFYEDGGPWARPDVGAVAPERGSALLLQARAGHRSGGL